MNAQTLQQLLPLIIIFVLFYLFLIMPQQKKQKERKNMLANLKKGDKIITIGGIYGTIVEIKDDELTLDLGDGIKIKVSRGAIGGIRE